MKSSETTRLRHNLTVAELEALVCARLRTESSLLSRTGEIVVRELLGLINRTPKGSPWEKHVRASGRRVFKAALVMLSDPKHHYGGLRGRLTLWTLRRSEVSPEIASILPAVHRLDIERVVGVYQAVFDHFQLTPRPGRSIPHLVEILSIGLDGMLVRAEGLPASAQAEWTERFEQFLVDQISIFAC